MNSFHKFLFLIPILICGCKSTEVVDNITTQTINSLNMNIYTNEGDIMLNIKSPYSIYDKEKNIFNLKKTKINLFKNNESKYIIISDKSKLSNNNKLLVLNGNVLVESSNDKETKLYSNSFTWNIQNSEYLLVGNVNFQNDKITLSSNKAILNRSSNIIEFFKPVKYISKDFNNERKYEINSENAYYNIDTKSVSFKSREKRVRSKIYF